MSCISKHYIEMFLFMIIHWFKKENNSLPLKTFTDNLINILYNFKVTTFIVIYFLSLSILKMCYSKSTSNNNQVSSLFYIKQPHMKLFCARMLLPITYATKYDTKETNK